LTALPPPRLNFNAATGSFFNWIFNWDDSRYINPSSPRSTLCLLLLLFPTTLGAPALPRFFSRFSLARKFSLGVAFFTADYVCGYHGCFPPPLSLSLSLSLPFLSFSIRGQSSTVVYGRTLKYSTFFSPELNDLRASLSLLPLSSHNVYTVFSMND